MKPTELPAFRRRRVGDLAGAARAYVARGEPGLAATYRLQAAMLRRMSLWWVSAEMTALALDASRSLPDEWSALDLAPDESGFLWWDGVLPPQEIVDSDGSDEAQVRGCYWYRLEGDVACNIIMDYDGDMSETNYPLQVAPGGEDHPEVIALIATTWLLMMEPKVCDQGSIREHPPKPKKGERKRKPETVSVIALRAIARPPVEPDPADQRRWRLTRRHMVRGHWRNQPVGVGRTGRELRWIPAHLKGPEGAPLSSAEQVHVWRR